MLSFFGAPLADLPTLASQPVPVEFLVPCPSSAPLDLKYSFPLITTSAYGCASGLCLGP